MSKKTGQVVDAPIQRLLKIIRLIRKTKLLRSTYLVRATASAYTYPKKAIVLCQLIKQIMQKENNYIKLKALLVNIYPSFRDHLYNFIDDILEAFPNLKGFVG